MPPSPLATSTMNTANYLRRMQRSTASTRSTPDVSGGSDHSSSSSSNSGNEYSELRRHHQHRPSPTPERQEPPTPEAKSRHRSFGETWVDTGLDWLRTHRPPPYIDAPLAYLVAFVCLWYKAYCYVQLRLSTCTCTSFFKEALDDFESYCHIPLVTESKNLGDEDGDADDDSLLQRLHESLLKDIFGRDCTNRARLVEKLRQDIQLRRRLQRFVNLLHDSDKDDAERYRQLYNVARDVWPDVLKFPELSINPNSQASSSAFAISLVIPAFRESGRRLQQMLECAWEHCGQDPIRIQVIVVDCGQCAFLDRLHAFQNNYLQVKTQVSSSSMTAATSTKFGSLEIVKQQRGGGGRGPSLNFGASHAKGRIITFLHSDTRVPVDWDVKIEKALFSSTTSGVGAKNVVQACVFSLGHDETNLEGRPYPYGLRSVWVLGNLRAILFRLPYGDHVISMPKLYFDYIGGYPDQPIMEDYELMNVLRQRATATQSSEVLDSEAIRIIPPPTCQCSVRRWQSYGVTYTTLVNTLIVYRYAQGWTPDEIFQYYYVRPAETKKRE